jgi:hypothetical protein
LKSRVLEFPELSKKEKILFIFIITFGFLLRFYGIWRNLPYGLNADEPLLLREALRFGKSLNIGEFVKSAPFMVLNFSILSSYYVAGKVFGFFQSPEDIAVKFVRDPAVLYFLIRTVASILSTFSILLMGIFIYRFFRKKSFFFLSIALYSFLPASVLIGRIMKEDNLAIPFFLLALIYLYTLYDEGGAKKFFIAGFLTGIAVAGKGYAIFLYPVIFLIWLQRREGIKSFLSSVFGVIIGNSIANPYPYFNLDRNITTTFLGPALPFLMNLFRIKTSGESFRYAKISGGLGWKMGEGLRNFGEGVEGGTGWLFVGILTISFFYVLIKKREKGVLPALLFIPLYLIAFFLNPQPFFHYFLPLIPWAFLVIFMMAEDLKGIYKYGIFSLLLLSFVFISAKKVIPYMFGEPTEKLALEWINKNISNDKKLLIDQGLFYYGLPEKRETIIREFEQYKMLDPSIRGTTYDIRLKFADENGYDIYRTFIYDPEAIGLTEERPGIYTAEEVKKFFDYVIIENSNIKKAKEGRLKWMKEFYVKTLGELTKVAEFVPDGFKVYGDGITIYRVK